MRARVLCLGAALLGSACSPSARPEEPPAVTLDKGQIVVRRDSPLIKNLEVSALPASGGGQAAIRVVGQIIALANRRADLVDESLDWVELDPEFTRLVGLDLASVKDGKPGDAIGYAELPISYARMLRAGERLAVERYGMVGNSTPAAILFVRLGVQWQQNVPIVFRMSGEHGWLPGSTCEVTFPTLTSHHIRIPTTALLHDGIYEYVLKEAGPGRFVPARITIGDGDAEEVEAVMGVQPSDRILGRGAILLKPFLHDLMARSRQASHD